jgi:CheY-like chemotaxis protein
MMNKEKPELIILYIEDDPAHAEFIMRTLRKKISAQIIHATDGQEALDYLFERGMYSGNTKLPKPTMILLDLRLPKVDGLEVLKIIKSEENLYCIPTIVLTTSNAETDIDKAYKLHANSYLVKPLDFNQFIKLIDSIEAYWLSFNTYTKCYES